MPVKFTDTKSGLSLPRLKKLLEYDPETGDLTWRVPVNGKLTGKRKAGRKAGCLRSDGYISIMLDGHLYLAHRLAWYYVFGKWPVDQLDHINEQRNDNRIINLREASRQQNSFNRMSVKGIFKREYGFTAQITVNGKGKYLGHYKTLAAASEAYKAASLKYHGAFSPFLRKVGGA